MALIKFYRGLKSNYKYSVEEPQNLEHQDGLYFATDTKEILLNGQAYGGLTDADKVVQDVTLTEDNTKLHVEYTDGSSSDIPLPSGKYQSSIEDKELTMPNAVGGIAKGTKVSDLEGNSYDYLWDELLFPTINPTFTNPSASISFKGYSSPQEVGAVAPTAAQFNTSLNKGAINLNGVKQADRSGDLVSESSFIYYNGSESNKELPTKVALGNTTYQYHASYAQGPQPKDNKGNNYQTPLPAGSVNSNSITLNGTYPWYASTSGATSGGEGILQGVVKQALINWNASAGAMSTPRFVLQPSGTLPQVFKLPRQIKELQMLNTVSNQMEVIGRTDYTETTLQVQIDSTPVTYYIYTYNGSARGEVTLLAKF